MLAYQIRSDYLRIKQFRRSDGLVSKIAIVFSASFHAVLIIRLIYFLNRFKLLRFISKILQAYLFIVFKIVYSPKISVGAGLFLPHPMNIIIGCACIGTRVTIMQGVTLGASKLDSGFSYALRPVIGDNVLIGVNSVVIGGGKISDGSIILPVSVINL